MASGSAPLRGPAPPSGEDTAFRASLRPGSLGPGSKRSSAQSFQPFLTPSTQWAPDFGSSGRLELPREGHRCTALRVTRAQTFPDDFAPAAGLGASPYAGFPPSPGVRADSGRPIVSHENENKSRTFSPEHRSGSVPDRPPRRAGRPAPGAPPNQRRCSPRWSKTGSGPAPRLETGNRPAGPIAPRHR